MLGGRMPFNLFIFALILFNQKPLIMKIIRLLLSGILFFTISAARSQHFTVHSPDENIFVNIEAGKIIWYAVDFKEKEIIGQSPVSMTLGDGTVLGRDVKIKGSSVTETDEIFFPVVKEKFETIRDHYNELTIRFKGHYELIFRAYNDGVAYRWKTNFKSDIIVSNEEVTFALSDNDSIYFPEEESFLTHSERAYPLLAVKDITAEQMSCVPALVCKPDGVRIAITEADLLDYPGMYLTGNDKEEPRLTAKFPPYPLEETQKNDRTMVVSSTADYIAATTGERTFPWRVMIITDNDGALIESELVYQLASPNKLPDFFWIEPGKVAWDWWNALNIYGVDFESGLNTDTYKYYIDFASEYKIPYIILDEGWSDTEDLFALNPDIDLSGLLSYAEEKNVGIILWVVWLTLDRQLDQALDQFRQWGVKGIKVDFMQRDDQKMVNYYEKVAAAAAERKLLVDFHGAYKPTGLRRTYPNVITREGVRGLEWNKWSDAITPSHDLILPFTRMVAGPMDYTPGAMINANPNQFHPVFSRPMSQGTRCHQLAMYVIYNSPLQMLADSPSNYYKEPLVMEFLKEVPTTWDDTKVFEAEAGKYLVMAHRKESKWYIGAMTNETPREFEIDLSFLDNRLHTAKIWQDGVNAGKNPIDFKYFEKPVTPTQKLKIKLAPGGGYVAIID